MSTNYRSLITCLALACASAVHAQTTPAPAQEAAQIAAPTPTVHVNGYKKSGWLEYPFFYDMQTQLQSYQPREPRVVDLMLQAYYTEMTEAQRDAYMPKGDGIDIRGRTVDVTLPVRRGGYFVLPALSRAYNEDAVILLEKASKDNILNIAWALRVGASHRVTYATLQKALAEVQLVQGKIPFFMDELHQIKTSVYSGMKACFRDLGGQVLIAGQPVEDAAVGDCTVVKIDPAYPHPDDVIEFSGPLDIVTIVDTRVYAAP